MTKRDYASESEWRKWNWRSEEDLLMNGAFFVQSGRQIGKTHKKEVIKAKPGKFVRRLTRFAGALNCVEHKLC